MRTIILRLILKSEVSCKQLQNVRAQKNSGLKILVLRNNMNFIQQ